MNNADDIPQSERRRIIVWRVVEGMYPSFF
jgi:hypothetical protein